jgi:hypothetical protein
MKPTHILGISILIVFLLATTLVVSAFHQPPEPSAGLNLLASQSRVQPAQIDTDLSEIGSTTGIFIMGLVIVLIISTPLLLRKKRH